MVADWRSPGSRPPAPERRRRTTPGRERQGGEARVHLVARPASPASTFKNAGKACQARIDAENAKGGVNGRKIELEIIDDESSGANLTATQDLVQNRDVFAIVNNSSFAFLSYRYMLDQGVPMIGGGFDGTYYTQKGNEDIISALGSGTPVPRASPTTTTPKVMKQLGATKVAAVGVRRVAVVDASRPRRSRTTRCRGSGLDAVYRTPRSSSARTDVGPVVLGIKNSGADARVPAARLATRNLAIVQGLQQNGVEMKANILATGYGQDLLDSPIAKTLTPEHVMFQTLQAGRAEGQGDQAVPGRPEEVRRPHRRARLRRVHRLHHLRPGDPRPAERRRRPRPVRASSTGSASSARYDAAGLDLRADRHQPRALRQGRRRRAARTSCT